ncbi:MAG TPA: TatD family hydrolase [Candidatus Saccharimonadales bacterium]|nr:TatD family hydrolase [Candidatus Saccharimonadales bacterium]
MIDTHLHLLEPHFDADRPAVLQRAAAEGVRILVEIGMTVESSRRAVEFAERHAGVYAVVGFHPNHASDARPGDVDRLLELARHPKVVGWGEIGLDFYRDYAPRSAQEPLFRDQIRAAREAGLPIVVHQRAAETDVLDILEEERAAEHLPVNLHCFAGGPDTARRVVPQGYYFGYGGGFTYARAGAPSPAREALAVIPRDRLLLETDAPYLAPVPHRGKRNEPAFLRHSALALAAALGLKFAELEALTDANARRFFHRMAAQAAAPASPAGAPAPPPPAPDGGPAR